MRAGKVNSLAPWKENTTVSTQSKYQTRKQNAGSKRNLFLREKEKKKSQQNPTFFVCLINRTRGKLKLYQESRLATVITGNRFFFSFFSLVSNKLIDNQRWEIAQKCHKRRSNIASSQAFVLFSLPGIPFFPSHLISSPSP